MVAILTDRSFDALIAVAQANGIIGRCRAEGGTHQSFLQRVQKTLQSDLNLVSVRAERT